MNCYRLLIFALITLGLASCAATRQSGVYHTVKKGQTLYTISRIYQIDEHYLARINGIPDPTQLQVGERVYIPGAKYVKSVPITVKPEPVVKKPSRPKPTVAVKPKPKPVSKPKVTKPRPASRPKTTSSKAPVSKGRFIWPVKGQILKKFGSGTSKGLEIAAAKGTPVASAAAGKVIYSGSGITGYGNLVIVRHDDTFFTVYGYNQKNLVAAGAFVSKGEKLALSGKPPSGGKYRAYFEIRYGKKPVNPLAYLP